MLSPGSHCKREPDDLLTRSPGSRSESGDLVNNEIKIFLQSIGFDTN